MPEVQKLAKAELYEIELSNGDDPPKRLEDTPTVVDFNPETLRVTYANTIEGKDQRGGSTLQFVTKSSTTLAVDLWFDVTRQPGEEDVRVRTRKLRRFLVPRQVGKRKDPKFVPPGVQFIWGTFLFEGVMESLDETLELFSTQGRPLRARVSLRIGSQDIRRRFENRPPPGSAGGTPGTEPRNQVRQNDTVQQAAARDGRPGEWQRVAAANGIENPRRPPAGTLLRMDG